MSQIANGKLASKVVRCAIYTRKSTEEGLEQAFNTLDAQRATAEAYIASQQHEGWRCLPERYDDGGFTGGNLDRPALQRLLEHIAAGQVDCVLTHKVDRWIASRPKNVAVGHHAEKEKLLVKENRFLDLERLLAPLCARLPEVVPGDWLSENPEAGQSFDAYRVMRPARKSQRWRTLYLTLIGEFGGVPAALKTATPFRTQTYSPNCTPWRAWTT